MHVGCREGQLQRVHHVLNECLVDRGASPNMVQLEAYVDGHHITTVQVLIGLDFWLKGSRAGAHVGGGGDGTQPEKGGGSPREEEGGACGT